MRERHRAQPALVEVESERKRRADRVRLPVPEREVDRLRRRRRAGGEHHRGRPRHRRERCLHAGFALRRAEPGVERHRDAPTDQHAVQPDGEPERIVPGQRHAVTEADAAGPLGRLFEQLARRRTSVALTFDRDGVRTPAGGALEPVVHVRNGSLSRRERDSGGLPPNTRTFAMSCPRATTPASRRSPSTGRRSGTRSGPRP